MASWLPIFAMPNLCISAGVESSGLALLPQEDPRVQEALGANESLAYFFRCFTTPTGGQISPPILGIDHQDSKPTIEELIAFRNIVAMCHLTMGWSGHVLSTQSRWVLYSNAFELYPCTVDKDKGIIWRTPVTYGWDEATKLRGQCSPMFPHPSHFNAGLDTFLFEGLMRAWRLKYRSKRQEKWLTQLFRSLQMAYMAMETPFANHGNEIDWGTSSSLWVSAFEVLSHKGWVGYNVVADSLEKAPWIDPKIAAHQRHRYKYGTRDRTSLVGWLYLHLYSLRNDTLHGNPMKTGPGFEELPAIAILLFRGMLLRTVMSHTKYKRSEWDTSNFVCNREWDNESKIERALLKAAKGLRRRRVPQKHRVKRVAVKP